MSNTQRLGLPLVQAAQAQKHVTVNEALQRLDGLTNLVLQSVDLTNPPAGAVDGDCYGVPAGAVNGWAGQDGQVAIRAAGGWVFATPQRGWRAHVIDRAAGAVHDGAAWRPDVVAISPAGAATRTRIVEITHSLAAGPGDSVIGAIPAGSLVLGVTGRVLSDVTGTLTSWRIGVAGADNRYGSGLGLATGSWLRGLTGSPQAYYSDTDLVLTGEGGDFAAGSLRLCVHLFELDYPLP